MKKELELVKPTYVLMCGRLSARSLQRQTKATDLVGRKANTLAMDLTVFYGFNPGILHFRPEEEIELLCEDIKGIVMRRLQCHRSLSIRQLSL